MERTTRTRRGASFIEVLVATMIIVVSLLGALSLYGFSLGMTEKTGDEGVAYNLARRALEDARQLGFSYVNLPEGTTTTYYDAFGANPSTTAGTNHKFRLVREVSSDKYSTLSGGGTRPSDDAIRSVKIEVYRRTDNQLLYQVGTHVVRSGV